MMDIVLGHAFTKPSKQAKEKFAFLKDDKFKLTGIRKIESATLLLGQEDHPPHPKQPKEGRYVWVVWMFPDDTIERPPEKWVMDGPFPR